MSEPLVSVVTPFYNTSQYLAQCIESVLAQTYYNFEYILSDNCSTDGSRSIAENYARQDSRIRLIRQPRLLPQVPHYNAALAAISPESKYCKMVQADDWVFPGCLRSMVDVFEQWDSVGIVSSFDLKGTKLRGAGYPGSSAYLPGKQVACLLLRSGVYLFGSPSTVMYRSLLIREHAPFFREGLLHEDTEKCMEILGEWDFGFVRQVLSFSRDDNPSISTAVSEYKPQLLDRYIIVKRFANQFIEPNEAESLKRATKRSYYSMLAEEFLRPRGARFWKYNQDGLRTINERLEPHWLGWFLIRRFLWMILNPGLTIVWIAKFCRRTLYAIDIRIRRFGRNSE